MNFIIKKEKNSIPNNLTSNEIDFQLAVKHTRWVFYSLGLLHVISDYSTIIEKYLTVFIFIFCEFLMFSVIIPSFYYLLFSTEDFKMKIAVFGPIGAVIICVFKYHIVIHHRKNLKKCFNKIKSDWEKVDNSRDRNIMIENANKGNNVTIFFAIFMYTGGVSHQAAAPFLPGSLISILKNSSDRPLVFPVTIISSIMNTQITPVYEIIYLLHILMGVVVCSMSVGTCNLGAICVTHVCGQIQIIIAQLENLTYDNNNYGLNKKIAVIVQLHSNVIKFCWDIQKVLGEICLIEVIGAIGIICVDQYYCVTAWKYNETAGFLIYLTLFFAFTFNIFIFCYIGELLKDQFNKVGQSIYMCSWHLLPPKKARDFIVIITMAQNPVRLTASGLMELSCNGFTVVMKTTVAFFNILRMVEL